MKKPKLNLHIRLNPKNPHHMELAEFLSTVDSKSITALMVVAFEEYRKANPNGIDYGPIRAVMKASHTSYQPKAPIQQNVKSLPSPEKQPRTKSAMPSDNYSKKEITSTDNIKDFFGVG